MGIEAHILAITIAHAKLALAQQRVLECELNFAKGLVPAQHAVALAVHELKLALAIVTGETP